MGEELGRCEVLLGAVSTGTGKSMTRSIYWFRNDLRLHDQRGLMAAADEASELALVYLHDARHDAPSSWLPFCDRRMGLHRRRVLADTLIDLRSRLSLYGSADRPQRLTVLSGGGIELLIDYARRLGVTRIHCEQIAAPEEEADVAALRAAGLDVHTHWQSSLLEPDDLPFEIEQLPRVFTRFREWSEKAQVWPRKAIAAPNELPRSPESMFAESDIEAALDVSSFEVDPRSAFPYSSARCRGGETAALGYLKEYFESEKPQSYKVTRNGLVGVDYSTKFSPWLASGAISPRRIFEALKAHEAAHGANESTYWIWFELLWRDYFRLLHLQHGKRLYRAAGLSLQGIPRHDRLAFMQWCQGASGERLIDAGMRELAQTGYLSNRLRQNVASYLVHDLTGDWRAGAAWFEHQLVDFDIYSNQGNWLYVSGRGTDPRIGRRFDPDRQARQYDVDGAYRRLWLES
ncbi:MAG: hypothetical protein RLZ79_31 [Pseudomonadota bacterium]